MNIVAFLVLLVIILFLTWHWIMLVILCPFIIRRQKDQYLRWEKQYRIDNKFITNPKEIC